MSNYQTYPDSPGFKVPGTSQAAAERIAPKALTLRNRVLEYINGQLMGCTADEVAAAIGESILSVRPRVSELHRMGEIVATGERFCNQSGMTANAWRIAPPLPSDR